MNSPSARIALAALSALIPVGAASADSTCAVNAYRQTNLVSNLPELNPHIVDPLLRNGWGIAIRPPGAGGHFWISNAGTGTTTTYVGDVPYLPIYQDELTVVDIPPGNLFYNQPDRLSQPTGQVYTGRSGVDFIVTGEGISGPSKFVFVTLDGTISGWTTGQTKAVTMVDESINGAMYSGLAVTERAAGNRLYVCNFGLERIDMFDSRFNPVALVPGAFRDPQVWSTYAAYNMQYLDGLIYVAWARLGDETGEPDIYPGYGFVSAFDTDGNLVRQFEHRLELNAPWGLAIAPANFGALSNTLLVGNFGDGTILAYNRETGMFIDYLRGENGEPVMIDGIWGMLFGNGVRLGYSNHLYIAAGPNAETDGLFAKLEPIFAPGDINGDGRVDFLDLNQTLADYARTGGNIPGDVNRDGVVDMLDLNTVLGAYGWTCGR